MIGHRHTRLGRRRPLSVGAAVLLLASLVVPAELRAVDPTPAPAGRPEMFRLGDPGGGASPSGEPRAPATQPRAPTTPSGFHDSIVFSGLVAPTSIAFADDGRVFVAEKRGTVKVYDSVMDATPTTWADFQTNVHDFWDRGLLGMTLDPDFESNGRVYVLYTYNHVLGDAAAPPKWANDGCPNPPGSTTDGCVASARLSRLEAGGGGTWDGTEHVLVEGWCQVHPSHSIGTVAFGPDGALYAGAGEAASFITADYGQDFGPGDDTTPDNPCGDPPSPVGTALSPPTAEGGALRAQDLFTSGDPVGLSGSIIRVNPLTGAAMPDNANAGLADANGRRIVAYGLRNPFRFTFRPGTSELWIGDVGAFAWEEFNRVVTPTGTVRNFGWPCYEGSAKRGSMDVLDLDLCEDLYADGRAVGPYWAYDHTNHVVPGDPCPDGAPIAGSVVSGTAFYPTSGGPFPAAYDGALFFADYGRNCIWAMRAGTGGLPDPTKLEVFASGLSGPVELTVGPDGALYYVGFDDGRIHRIAVAPRAVAAAEPTAGPVPLVVDFDGSGSSDPKGGALSYAWDLDGDGQFDDSTAVAPTWTYTEAGVVLARLRVTDIHGAFDIDDVSISPGNHPPVATITTPASTLKWSVGQTISFGGSASDAEDGTEPGSRLAWTVRIRHCPDACHSHTLQTSSGVGGSFPAPDHEYPSNIEIQLVATDAHGATSAPASVTIQPRTVELAVDSSPAGVPLTVGDTSAPAPFERTVIDRSAVQVSAPETATIGGRPYGFVGWSDGRARTHTVTARSTTPTLVATYAPATTFVPIAPVRVIDTRTGGPGALVAGTPRTFAVGGTHGIPASAVAITGNLTAVGPTTSGWVELASGPAVKATTSALNLPAGDTRANGVTALLGADGKLAATFRAPAGTTHLLLDVTGYFVPSDAGATFTPTGPSRVLDSRTGVGGFSTPFVSGKPRTIQLGGVGGVPADAVAVTGNLTVTGQTAGGYVSMTTVATTTPAVSTINVPRGDTRANGLTIRLSASGRAALVYRGSGAGTPTAHLIFDVTGYYRSGTGGLRFYPAEPRRIFDTRAADGPSLSSGVSRAIDARVKASMPSDVDAVVGNATVVGQTAAGYVSMTTLATSSPATSTLNFPFGDIRANNTVNGVDGNGRLRVVYKAPSGARTHFIYDLAGYFR